jgi:hypothetical protein
MANFKNLDLALKKSFGAIKREIKALKENTNNNMEDLSIIRTNLLEFNSLNKRVENIEKKFEELLDVKKMTEKLKEIETKFEAVTLIHDIDEVDVKKKHRNGKKKAKEEINEYGIISEVEQKKGFFSRIFKRKHKENEYGFD